LAPSRDTLNGPDWKDVTSAANHFARDWGAFVGVVMRPSGSDRHPVLTMVACVWGELRDVGVAPPLVSASVSMPGSGAGDMCAAALSALYELDKQMYRQTIGLPPPR
jgi:hypothetical protein